MKKLITSSLLITSMNLYANISCKDVNVKENYLLKETTTLGMPIGHLTNVSFNTRKHRALFDFSFTDKAIQARLFLGAEFPRITSFQLNEDGDNCILTFFEKTENVGSNLISIDPQMPDSLILTEGENSMVLIGGQDLEDYYEELRIKEDKKRAKEEKKRKEIKKLKSISLDNFCKQISYSSKVQRKCADDLSGHYYNEKALYQCSQYSISSLKLTCAKYIKDKEYTAEEVYEAKGSFGAVKFQTSGRKI